MDGQRFDAWTRAHSSSGSRRRVLRLAVGLAALALAPTSTAARQREPDGDPGAEPPPDPDSDRAAVCPGGVLCGTTCCPPETVGCTVLDLPDGTVVVGCLCPEGYVYLDGQCAPCTGSGVACDVDNECCSGVCCAGACCSEGEICVAGQCCPRDQACGDACCAEDQTCVEGICKAVRCVDVCDACDDSADCCGELICSCGVCQNPDPACFTLCEHQAPPCSPPGS